MVSSVTVTPSLEGRRLNVVDNFLIILTAVEGACGLDGDGDDAVLARSVDRFLCDGVGKLKPRILGSCHESGMVAEVRVADL